MDFGPAAAEVDEDQVTLAWYNYLFKGAKNQFSRETGSDLCDGHKPMAGRRRLAAAAGAAKPNIFCMRSMGRIRCGATARFPRKRPLC